MSSQHQVICPQCAASLSLSLMAEKTSFVLSNFNFHVICYSNQNYFLYFVEYYDFDGAANSTTVKWPVNKTHVLNVFDSGAETIRTLID